MSDPRFSSAKTRKEAAVGRILIVFFIALSTVIGSSLPSNAVAQDETVSLSEKYAKYFTIGAAADSTSFRDKHVPLLKKHFNGFTCENEMKWESLEPREGEFRYIWADRMVAFAEENKMKIRGHCLVWHKQTPGWVFVDAANAPASKEVLIQRMKNHITNVMTHFKGKVYAWDVVNEAVMGSKSDGTDAGEDLTPPVTWGYRNSAWYKICGEDYIFEAFRAARAADPGAKLFYNDFWNWLDGKRAAIIAIIKRLQKEKLIDGVGLQCHMNIEPSRELPNNQSVYQTIANLEKEIKAYAALGLEIHVTELDVSMYTRDYPSNDQSKWYKTEADVTEALQDQLAARYKEFFALLRKYRKNVTNVTFWGIADDNTWLSEFASRRPDYPLLFDKELKPKKAFFAVVNF